MQFNVTNNLSELHKHDYIITGIFEDLQLFPTTQTMNDSSKGYIISLLKNRKILNKKIGQIIILYDVPNLFNQQILLVNCGKINCFNSQVYKKIILKLVQFCKNISANKIFLTLSEFDIKEYNNYWKIRQTIEIFTKELYVFNYFKDIKNTLCYSLNTLTFHIPNHEDLKNCEKSIKETSIITDGIKISKDLSNMPPNICTPDYLIQKTIELSNNHDSITVEIINSETMKKLGMNAYLSVGQGSYYPPRMSILKYTGYPQQFNMQPIVLIGKGLTFDSGGISIKESNRMDEMKYDMCGAAVVYSIMYIASKLKLPINIIGILATCENMINNTALRPGDILTTLSGKTVEVLNTDAEGRLVLCDVLTYVERYKPRIVIDIATLTGACVIALGTHFNGLMSNNEKLSDELLLAAKQSEDYTWKLPLHNLFQKQLQSTCADIKNVGGRDGSAITAGCFLQNFAQKYHWAHLDIAGTAWISNNKEKNATGRPISLLTQFLMNKSKNS